MSPAKFKIFCDESCHLQHDNCNVMVLGALFCPEEDFLHVNKHIKWLRNIHNYKTELKWTKLISMQEKFYYELLNFFFESPLRFKATIVLNKNKLNHERYNNGSHGIFYYKMFYYTLRDFIETNSSYKIYLDYMDSLGGEKVKTLNNILIHESIKREIDANISSYIIRSYESQLIQLCDILIGAITYKNRSDIPKDSKTKNIIIDFIEHSLCRRLNSSTPPWEEKFNIFMFSPKEERCFQPL